MDWLALTLLSAFSVASADALTKRCFLRSSAQEIVLIRFGLSGALLAPLLLFQPWPDLPPAFWGWVAALVPLEILAMLLYMRAIQESPLGLTLPYLAFTPVFAAGTGMLLLGERPSLRGLAGIALVVAGAYLLNLSPGRAGERCSWTEPLRAIARERGSRHMLIVAALYSLTSVMGKGALQYAPPLFFAPFYYLLIGAVCFLLFVPRRPARVHVLWQRPVPTLSLGLLMAVMVLAHFAAIQRVEVAYMIAVKRTSLLFGILYGGWLFREPQLRQRLGAGALMVAGVALVAL